jgi:hypothetical protein
MGGHAFPEFDSQLEGGLGAPHHFRFVDAQGIVEAFHVRQGGFAHAYDAYLVGLDEAHRAATARQ